VDPTEPPKERIVNCPNCQAELKISERQGIEIDYCPQCRGVWLDRGELDKIVERSADELRPLASESAPRPGAFEPRDRGWQRERGYDRDRDDDDHDEYRGRRRRSFLDDLFDFRD
jgi:Zn-finger nucleic acid-binding protein